MTGNSSDTIQDKRFSAEEKIAYVRLLVTILNTVVYHFLLDKTGTIPWLAYTIIIVAWCYAPFIILLKPYRKYNVLPVSYFTSAADAVLIALFIWATGKTASPFYPLWLISIVAVAFRFSLSTTLFISGLYVFLDAGIFYLSDSMSGNAASITLRSGYILATGLLSGLLSAEIIRQIRDKTGLKEVQEELQNTLKLSKDTEKIANIGSWEWNMISDKITWSDQLYRIYGLKPKSIKLNFESFLQRIHPDDRELITKEVMYARETLSSFDFYHRIIWDTGEQKTLYGRGEVIAGKEGNPVKMRGVAQDVTEQQQMEEELRKAYAEMEENVAERTKELKESNQDLAQFAFIVSHDLKAPLRAINTLSGFIIEDYREKLGPEGLMQLKMLQNSALKMSRLIDGILTYSQIGNKTTNEYIDLNLLVNEVIELIKPPENISVQVQKELPVLYFDKTQLTQVFENLICNAVKHMDKPNGLILIDYEEKDPLRFSVNDNGPGISAECRERIFQMFQTAGNKKDSTGIGLTIVKKIIEKAGGEVGVEEKPDTEQGSTFYFTLPKSVKSAPDG